MIRIESGTDRFFVQYLHGITREMVDTAHEKYEDFST